MNPNTPDYHIWHPFSQMKGATDLPLITKAQGAYLYTSEGKKIFDAISSWWVTLHGHSHPHIAQRMHEQLNTLEHVIFAGFTHEPAIQLCQRLLPHLPGKNWKFFFSDNGSTAVEVALKMAIQYIRRNARREKVKVIALEGSYHGDTFGAMAAAERSIFTDPWDDLFFEVTHIPPPVQDKEAICLQAIREAAEKNSIFIYEPLVQGAGGMQMYSEELFNEMITIAQKAGTVLIADEVMTGFGRTGRWFASEAGEATPDFICLSKGLTGGALPMSLTLCQQYLYDAFLDDAFEKGFLHGHSFTGNPLGCAAALASLDLMELPETWTAIKRFSTQYHAALPTFEKHPLVRNARYTGCIFAIDVKEAGGNYLHPLRDRLYQLAMDKGILLRPLGNVLYLLPPYCSSEAEITWSLEQMLDILSEI